DRLPLSFTTPCPGHSALLDSSSPYFNPGSTTSDTPSPLPVPSTAGWLSLIVPRGSNFSCNPLLSQRHTAQPRSTPQGHVLRKTYVMAIPVCQLDSIWNDLQSRIGGLTCDPDLEAGRHKFLTSILAWRS
ncbi:mCG146153, partial [Mus musculus]